MLRKGDKDLYFGVDDRWEEGGLRMDDKDWGMTVEDRLKRIFLYHFRWASEDGQRLMKVMRMHGG